MTLNQAIETAKKKAADSPRWLRAIERAAAGLQSGELCVTLLQHDALVTSPNGSYRVNGHCQCAAAQRGHSECYHRAAVRPVEMLETETAPAVSFVADVEASTRKQLIAEIENIWPRFAPGVPLYTELLARFGKSHLDMLDVGLLRDIRLAVAM